MYKYAFYRVCKDAPVEAVAAHSNASTAAAAGRRHVTISLRANQLETEVVYQTMTMFRQQRRGVGGRGGGRGCWMSADLGENRISHLLDIKAVAALTRYGEPIINLLTSKAVVTTMIPLRFDLISFPPLLPFDDLLRP